jgi:hypothetical protein
VPHVSPLKGPSRSFEFTEKKMEDEEMVRSIARDRLTPRNDHPPTLQVVYSERVYPNPSPSQGLGFARKGLCSERGFVPGRCGRRRTFEGPTSHFFIQTIGSSLHAALRVRHATGC